MPYHFFPGTAHIVSHYTLLHNNNNCFLLKKTPTHIMYETNEYYKNKCNLLIDKHVYTCFQFLLVLNDT